MLKMPPIAILQTLSGSLKKKLVKIGDEYNDIGTLIKQT
jgi:hypothetical protein